MTGGQQLARVASFPGPKGEAMLLRIASMDFDGDSIVSELEHSPDIVLRGTAIDFASNMWDFSTPDSPPTGKTLLRAKFDEGKDGSVWKLFLACSLIWKRRKTVTLVARLNGARKAFKSIGGKDARRSQLSISGYQGYIGGLSARSQRSAQASLTSLLEFLTFRRSYFHVPIDPELESRLCRDIEARKSIEAKVKTPEIDVGYLRPLIKTCQTILDNEEESHTNRIYAAAILIVSQTGIRMSELLGLEEGRVEVSKIPGKEDIAYLRYSVFKGSRKEGGEQHITPMNEVALRGYRWLEENCRRSRERLGVRTLIVGPKQRTRYHGSGNFMRGLKILLLSHSDSIPCIDTQETYPDLQRKGVAEILSVYGKTAEQFGLSGSETLVYPKIHSFRVTVATQHYVRGDDLHYISRRLGHATEAMTSAYIQSDKALNEANNDLVYRTVLGDGAEFIGPRGREFQQKVEQFVKTLPDHVKGNLDEIVAAAGKMYPLRRKVGGVCVRCGWVKGCKRNDETDQIYCAFGVCPNQCVLYFMADQCLGTVRSHMELVKSNRERGHTKAARNELRKAQNVMRSSLVPELDSLEKQIGAQGRDGVLARFPELEEIVDNLSEVREEVAGWLEMSI